MSSGNIRISLGLAIFAAFLADSAVKSFTRAGCNPQVCKMSVGPTPSDRELRSRAIWSLPVLN